MREFWAKRGRKIVGPFPTREDALRAFAAAYPFKGKLAGKADAIMSGFGMGGPYSDLRWTSPLEIPASEGSANA